MGNTNFAQLINDLYAWISLITAAMAFLLYLFAGYMYMTGDPKKMENAKKYAQDATIALVVVAFVWVFLKIFGIGRPG